jgi:hypothetical protein
MLPRQTNRTETFSDIVADYESFLGKGTPERSEYAKPKLDLIGMKNGDDGWKGSGMPR